MNSRFDLEEKIVSAVGALISGQVAIKLDLPSTLPYRAVYLFLEAVPTAAGTDFQVEAEVRFYRNNSLVHSIPASIADNSNAAGVVTKTQLTAFANVAAGQNENLLAKLSAPAANGASAVVLSPQKLQLETDEVRLVILGSKNTGNSFATWRALLGVRSSLSPL
jgi:hypothetical protein